MASFGADVRVRFFVSSAPQRDRKTAAIKAPAARSAGKPKELRIVIVSGL
jgi:hypothetical protein